MVWNGQQLGAPYTAGRLTRYDLQVLGYTGLGTVAAVLSLLKDFVLISLAAETS